MAFAGMDRGFCGGFPCAFCRAAWWLGPLTRLFARLPRALARGRENSGLGPGRRISGTDRRLPWRPSAAAVRCFVSLPFPWPFAFAKYASLFALTESLLAGTGYAAPHPNPWDLVIGVSATELIASLPIPAIGQFGVWEGGMVGVLVMMGFHREQATLVAFGVHGITTAFEYLVAALALAGLLVVSKKRRGMS